MNEGTLLAIGTTIGVALIGGFFTWLVRKSREATTMSDAWQRIDKLQRDLDVVRVAVRIGEEGIDAFWSWGNRVRGDWNKTERPPEFTPDESRAIARARRSIEIADTSEIPVASRKET